MNYAIIIGIDNYNDPQYITLKYAQSDAKAFRDKLVFMPRSEFLEKNIYLLCDDSEDSELPNYINILKLIDKICKAVTEDDMILFYFAGHGFDYENISYLVVKDTEHVVIDNTALSVKNHIIKKMNNSKALHKVMILDACRVPLDGITNNNGKRQIRLRSFNTTLQNTLSNHEKKLGWELIVACGPGQFTYEDKKLKGGIWTQSLIQAIDELINNTEITVRNLFEKAKIKVQTWWKVNNKKGVIEPWYTCSISDSAIINRFNKKDIIEDVSTKEIIETKFNVKTLIRSKDGEFKIVKKINDDYDDITINLMEFTSDTDRDDLKLLGKEAIEANSHFDLRFYMPKYKKNKKKYNELFLLFNGLGESNPAIFDDIGLALAEKNIPAVLIPLSCHFVREFRFKGMKQDPYQPIDSNSMRLSTQLILQGILRNPCRILNGFKQVIDDTGKLISLIQSGFHPLLSKYFNKNTEFSLFGYSIGGLAAMSLLLLHPEKYKSVFLLESGAYLDQIKVDVLYRRPYKTQRILWKTYTENDLKENKEMESLFTDNEKMNRKQFEEMSKLIKSDGKIDSEEPWRVFERDEVESREIWQNIMAILYDEIGKKGSILSRIEEDIFERVFLGYRTIHQKRELADLYHKILIIVGGADDIFPLSLLQNASPDTGLAMLQIPRLSHWLKYKGKDEWEKWKHPLVDIMKVFNEKTKYYDK